MVDPIHTHKQKEPIMAESWGNAAGNKENQDIVSDDERENVLKVSI